MGVWVGNTEITCTDMNGNAIDWARANAGDRIFIVLDFRVEEYVLADSGNMITINNTNGYLGGGWITDPANRFANFNIGDTIVLGNYVTFVDHGTATIINKQGNGAIQINSTLGFGNDVVNQQFIVSVANPITAIKYRYNFIENGDQPTFASKIDGSEQLLEEANADANNPAIIPMAFVGPKPYQSGAASLQGGTIFDGYYYFSTFRIYHETVITPLMLAEQVSDAENGIPPLYFKNSGGNNKCLKYIYGIEALYNYGDPNRSIALVESSIQGNTGWYGENFNTQQTNYQVTDVTYSTLIPFTIQPALQLTQDIQLVDITIKNTTDSPFVNGATKLVLNFFKVPSDPTEYQGPTGAAATRDMRTNFVHDRVALLLGSGVPVDGELSLISGMRVLRDVQAIFVSASEIRVFAFVEFGANSFAIVNEAEILKYMFYVSVADHTKVGNDNDRVNLPIGPEEYFIQTDDPNMIIINNTMVRHFEEDPDVEGVDEANVFPNDELAECGRFYIDRLGRETDDISLKAITMRVKAKNVITLDEFTLDTFSLDLSNAQVIGGYQVPGAPQNATYTLDRPFHIPTTEPVRKKIEVARRADLDTATKFYYDCRFPFLMRWEYWLAQADNNGDFFDTNEPLNGWNKFWHRYAGVANWGLYYEIKILAVKNGTLQQYTLEKQLFSNDYNSNPDWIDESIKTYDPDTLVELTGGGNKYLWGFKDNLVEARFKYNPLSFNVPTLADIAMVISTEVFEEGASEGRRRISSVWVKGDTWYKSIDTSEKIVLTQAGPGFIVIGQCLLDGTQLPVKPKFTQYARIYDMRLPEGGSCGVMNLRTEDGLCLTMEDGTPWEIEN